MSNAASNWLPPVWIAGVGVDETGCAVAVSFALFTDGSDVVVAVVVEVVVGGVSVAVGLAEILAGVTCVMGMEVMDGGSEVFAFDVVADAVVDAVGACS